MASAGSWRALIQSVASFRGDLSSLTAPPFILAPASLLEYSRYWFPGVDDFTAPEKIEDPEQRFLAVLHLFLGLMKGQYTQRNIGGGFEKKPLNPFLGELFVGTFDDGKAKIQAEQVSHHPPIYAYRLTCADSTVEQEGFVGIKAWFSTSICVKQEGHTVYKLPKFGEEYVETLPSLHLEGFLSGSPYIELDGGSSIVGSNGYRCDLQYSGAGYFRGKSHTLAGTIKKDDQVLYTLSGQWNERLFIKNEQTGKVDVFIEHQPDAPVPAMHVRPVEEQHPLESQKAWIKVIEAIRKNDTEATWREKSAIEDAQRQLRREEAEKNIEWTRRWFDSVPSEEDPLVSTLKVDAPPTVWRWSSEKFSKDKDFH